MRPPRLALLAFFLIFFPIFLTFYSVLTSTPHVSTPSSFAGQTTGLHALFSFNLPSSLFPPSAIISLTDENSTFFLARPAAFGPLLPGKGLSGQLWVGSGFSERSTGVERELGCSDIPGYEEGDSHLPRQSRAGKTGSDDKDTKVAQDHRHADFLQSSDTQTGAHAGPLSPPTNDGTDDHLHHPLPESVPVDSSGHETNRESSPVRQSAHADIQSLQESAEISGRVVLLSRGGCGFMEKVKWAQRRGAVAVVVGDDTRGGSLVTMYARGDTSNVTIPSMFTSYTTAHLLSSLVPPQEREELEDATKVSNSGDSEDSTTTSVLPSPSSTQKITGEHATRKSKSGLFHHLFSFLGFGGRSDDLQDNNRRPPSSGNINWIPLAHWDEQELSNDVGHELTSSTADSKNANSGASNDGDGFVIGVQDWRDPDLVAPKSSAVAVPTGTASEGKQHDKSTQSTATLKGGSITPGSGEYHAVEKSGSEDKRAKKETRQLSVSEEKSKSTRRWFSRQLFGAKSGVKADETKSVRTTTVKTQRTTRDVAQKDVKTKEHEGLWVTLTPTSMSTSPFFDTLLVLVVSPLLTLSVVYILLLLRSRIRRRRWRAPKSLVERLPVRTYHTLPTASSSSSSSLRSSSPGLVSQTSPLLGTTRSGPPRSRPRSQKVGSTQQSEPRSFETRNEMSGISGTSTWRRKYTGRQVECVVCLEEYVDGQSRVMSLPCGHEFHVECITPWLTTRRRTCPICKGDVVRSLSHNHEPRETDDREIRGASSAPVPISGLSDDEMSDLERRSSETGLDRQSSSTPPSWRNFAALSLSALSGDPIWHQGRADDN
ncbi:hypothetical protein BJX99DRAFT_225668 [Aspergillus californicus]